jgi:hypothetical protein
MAHLMNLAMASASMNGFIPNAEGWMGPPVEPQPLMARFDAMKEHPKGRELLKRIEDGSLPQDELLAEMTTLMGTLQRGITSGMTAFPVRENLQAEVEQLVPMETPVRNMLPRDPGSGKAAAWKQATSLGGGWGSSYDQPGGGSAAQAFFSETGAPAELTTVYADRSQSYKLMGTIGSVTGFAMASGANFQDQYRTERQNQIRNLMLLEEAALINADATATAAPWGDGTTAFSFDGIIPSIKTANGVPSAHIQTTVGALTAAHIDAQLTRIWKQGASQMVMLINAQEAQSLITLAKNDGTFRILTEGANNASSLGMAITGYVHPISHEVVQIVVSRFVPAGTMVFMAKQGPNQGGSFRVDVLPQVNLPALAPGKRVEGYTAMELAPTHAAPQVFKFIVSVFEMLKLMNGNIVAKSTGVTAAVAA